MSKIKQLEAPTPTQQPALVVLTAEQWEVITAEQRENREFRNSILGNAGFVEKPIMVDDAADYLNVSKKTLYEMVQKREIPFHRPHGNKIYFYRSALNEWIRKGGRK